MTGKLHQKVNSCSLFSGDLKGAVLDRKKSVIVLAQLVTLCTCPKREKCEKKYEMCVTIYTVHREAKYKFVMCELKFQKTSVPREANIC